MSTDTAAAWPRIEATIHEDGTGYVSIGGTRHKVAATNLTAARDEVRQLVAEAAGRLGRPVRAVMTDPDGQWPLIVNTDGTLEADEAAEALPRAETNGKGERNPAESPTDRTAGTAQQATAGSTPPAATRRTAETASTAVPPEQPYETRRERRARQSFLTQEQREEPATQGWRGALSRIGVRMSPSEQERAERADIQAVSQHWPGPRTIAVVNGKGGAGKTPTTTTPACRASSPADRRSPCPQGRR